MSDHLADLIARLEAATAGSRELEEDIAAALAGATLEVQPDGRRAWHRDTHWVSIGPVLPWTRSIDAALTLVPEGCWWNISQWSGPTGGPIGSGYMAEIVRLLNDRADMRWGSKMNSPALALCIAAMKARAASTSGRRGSRCGGGAG